MHALAYIAFGIYWLLGGVYTYREMARTYPMLPGGFWYGFQRGLALGLGFVFWPGALCVFTLRQHWYNTLIRMPEERHEFPPDPLPGTPTDHPA